MRSTLNAFVTAPSFDDEDRTRNARLAYTIVISTTFLNILSIVIDFVLSPLSSNITPNIVMAIVQVFLLLLVQRGYVTHVGIIFATVAWLLITYEAYRVDGLVNPIITLYVIPILFTGLLVSVRTGLALAFLCIVTVVVFALSARAGIYPLTDEHTPLGMRVGIYLSLFGFTGVAIYLSVGAIRNALTRVRVSEAQLRERNLQLQVESEKRATVQKELSESELRWRFALEGSDTGVWDMNLETQRVFRSPRYLELLGYSQDTLNDLPDLTPLIHPDDLPTVVTKRDAFYKDQIASYEDEMRILCADNTYKWFSYRGNIIERTAAGEPLRFAGTLTDITARKQLEAVQKATDEGYRTLFENNPNPMWVFEKATLRFIAVNDAAIKLYGYTRDEFMSMTIRDIRPEEDVSRLEAVIHDSMPVLSTPELWRHRTRDGRIILVEITGHETIFQGKAARLILVRDMTIQKETEESLRASQELFNKVFDHVPVGVSITRLADGRIMSVNPHMAAMLDYSSEAMIGHTGAELGIIERVARTTQMEGLKTQNLIPTTFEMDYKLKTRTGRSVDVLMSTQQVKIAGEDAFLSIVVDVTALKRTEREKAQIEILQSELDKKREIVELKERFISSVSHEFRSPLTIILTGTGILRMHDAKLSSEQRIERLGKIETQIYYLNDLLDRVLTIGKARAGKFQFDPQAIDIVKFCRALFEDFRLSDHDQHRFIFEASGDFSHAQMDEKLLQHILMNLISNAVKYSPTGKTINMRMKRDDSDIVIEISDQGIGIPEEEQNQVFEPFFRSQNAGSIKGTGLGLAITKESVDAHHGSITWYSQLGQGTTFIVRLPGGFQPLVMLA